MRSEFKIRINSIKDAAIFTNICNHFKSDIDLYIGSVCRDAKSLNSNINFIGKNNLFVKINCDDKRVVELFKDEIKLWIEE